MNSLYPYILFGKYKWLIVGKTLFLGNTLRVFVIAVGGGKVVI